MRLFNYTQSDRRGVYAVLTSFFFIIVALVATIGVLFYQNMLVTFERSIEKDANEYSVVTDAKNVLFSCYGKAIDERKLNKPCNVSMIQGYTIEKIGINQCNESFHDYLNNSRYDQSFVYVVPIQEDKRICLGRLKIFL
ncbi:hypothetical protein GF343_04305 [Candidatus Woesearchaeota archaeon]|nr:hypothetical protein [Candidatus Woesearchaeota archaeon]